MAIVRAFRSVVVAALVLTAGARAAAAQPDTALRPRRADVAVGGVQLATDIYAQAGAGERVPTVLIRTPYGREPWREYGEFFARRGYAVAVQDVRGRGGSTGQHVPFLHEEDDGAATLDWITAQPWSNGRVGMMGPSYLSFASLVLVARGHPALRAVVNNSGMSDLEELLFPGGAVNLMVGLPWTRLFAGPRVSPQQPWDSLFAVLPVASSFAGPSRALMGGYPELDGRLAAAGAAGRLRGRAVPTLHLTGWNDFLYRHTLQAHAAMQGTAAEQALVVGPWAHDQQQRPGRPTLGGEDFGDGARFGPDSVRALALHWFDRHLKQAPGAGPLPPVRVYTMGANVWETLDGWPAKNARRRTLYLAGGGDARGSGGDAGAGRLVDRAPRRAGGDAYTYDPNAPVPTVGGANFHLFAANVGPLDQRPVERRADVLSYTTAPFAEAATLAGPVSVTLHVSSSAPDADFTAKLVLVRPDGFARIVEDGVLRARFRRSRRAPAPLAPGAVVPVTIDLGATALRVPAGSRLRLEVSSGNFPKYDRNPQTGENPLTATTLGPATHEVHHGGRFPSAVTLWLRP
jgi:putative CocE/NonD family hydrolase